MAKAKAAAPVEALLHAGDDSVPRPRLHKLVVRNFCAIGPTRVEIELDDIVVLVGPNNVGKSSILRAYQVVMNHGSKNGHLSISDFHGGTIDSDNLPEIELQTIVFDNSPGDQWIQQTPAGESIVRERWFWKEAGPPIRQGFDVQKSEWSDQVPWGAPNVAKSRRPQPHRIDAFASPDQQATEIIDLLMSILTDRLKQAKAVGTDTDETSHYAQLLRGVRELQHNIVKEAKSEIDLVQAQLSEALQEVFPGYAVRFDARPEDDLEKCLSFFKAGPQLLLGPTDGYMSPVARQGSGARRTLLWTALRIIREHETAKSATDGETRPPVLLLDEPEICLHPSAIREACRVLYKLPSSGNWQVMLTTHSPFFIDLSQNNTTIVRVERSAAGVVTGTTLFRPSRVQLDDDDRARLKLLNLCDPHVNEFFFGGRTLIVEGDTEYTAMRYVADSVPDLRDVHVIRARGKATIASLVKVLNHFGSSYAVLHDSDRPTIVTKTGGTMANSAWTINSTIHSSVNAAPDPSRVTIVASVPNFELAFFAKEVSNDKPYNALTQLIANKKPLGHVEQVMRSLLDPALPTPTGVIKWKTVTELEQAVAMFDTQMAN